MTSLFDRIDVDGTSEGVVTRIGVPSLVQYPEIFDQGNVLSTESLPASLQGKFYSCSAFIDAIKSTERRIRETLSNPGAHAILIKHPDVHPVQLLAVKRKSSQRDLLEHKDLVEQAKAECQMDEELIAMVLPVTKDHASDPGPAEAVMALLKGSANPDATRRAIHGQISGNGSIIGKGGLLTPPGNVANSVKPFSASRPYDLSLTVKDVLNAGSEAVVILERALNGADMFFNEEIGNREIRLKVDGTAARHFLSLCLNLGPVSAKVLLDVAVTHRGLAYSGRLLAFNDPTAVLDAVSRRTESLREGLF